MKKGDFTMIIIPYDVMDSKINNAGKGVFVKENLHKGKVISAPDNVDKIYNFDEICKFVPGSIEHESCVRWFESGYCVVKKWSDECYFNHSFTPNCVWHLGFVFAARELNAGEEITIDYSYLLAEGHDGGFTDAKTGRAVVGMSFSESIRRSAAIICEIFK